MRAKLITALGTVVCLAALYAWSVTAPAEGSGWILFVAFLGTLGLLNSIGQLGLATAASAAVTVAAGFIWSQHREFDDAFWVLILAILCGFRAFTALRVLISTETKAPPKSKSKKTPTK